MAFRVLPAEKGDLYTLTEIFHEAFATDPEFCLMYRNCDQEDVVRGDFRNFEKDFEFPGRRYIKVVDENGCVKCFLSYIILLWAVLVAFLIYTGC
jgi:hypothetical protein